MPRRLQIAIGVAVLIAAVLVAVDRYQAIIDRQETARVATQANAGREATATAINLSVQNTYLTVTAYAIRGQYADATVTAGIRILQTRGVIP